MAKTMTMTEEIRKIYADLKVADRGISDSKSQKIRDRMVKKYRVSQMDVFIEHERVLSEIFGRDFDEEEERKILIELRIFDY